MRNIIWPEGKTFAFTIIDDTDNGTIENTKPIYDLLYELNFRTTKTVWSYPPRDDKYVGEALDNKRYLDFIRELKNRDFEIAFHNAGSGDFERDEIKSGLEKFKEVIGEYPKMHINHGDNKDTIYWGYKRYGFPLNLLFKLVYGGRRSFFGEIKDSAYFWGDLCKQHIKYIRNHVFSGINTLKYDDNMPYKQKNKEAYSNYWFSSSDGENVELFSELISKNNVDELENENGCCIVYTHFAYGFVDRDGMINKGFEERLRYLSSKNGWFVPASELLDYMQSFRKKDYISFNDVLKLDMKWVFERIYRRLVYKIQTWKNLNLVGDNNGQQHNGQH